MRAIVIANGHVGNLEASRVQTWTHDSVICADGGAQHALALGLAPDVVIGDLDSLDGDLQARLEGEGCQILVHPTRKDETDLELALRYAIDHGVDEILILGALGGRFDQTLANVLLLALPELEGIKTRIVAGDQEMFLIRGQALIKGQVGDTVSLLPIAGDVTGITTEGLEYPLQRGALKFGPTLGVSNVLAAPVARVQVEHGLLLCVHISNRMEDEEWRMKNEERRMENGRRQKMKPLTVRMLTLVLLLATLMPMAACGGRVAETPTPAGPRTLTIMSHDSFEVSEEVIAAFEEANNATIEFLKSGDTGAALNKAILSKENPLADVFFGVDNTFFSRAIEADIFEPYKPQGLEDIPDALELDSEYRLVPIDFGDVCLNYDKGYFEEKGLTPPQSLEDLTKLELKGLTVVENPATSSPGLSFLMATVGHFGETGDYTYSDFWADLRTNDVLVTEGWEDAYWGQSTWAGEGDRPIVVSYATSPAAEVYFSEGALSEPPTGNVLGEGACFRQIEFMGILKGTQNRDLAKKFVDFLLSKTFQEDIPLQMWVFPANERAALPQVFTDFAEVPEHPAEVSPEAIDQNREAWIEKWTEVVLR